MQCCVVMVYNIRADMVLRDWISEGLSESSDDRTMSSNKKYDVPPPI